MENYPACNISRGDGLENSKYDVFLTLEIILIIANSGDPDEMQHCAAFHLGLHCLPKYPFRGLQYTKG